MSLSMKLRVSQLWHYIETWGYHKDIKNIKDFADDVTIITYDDDDDDNNNNGENKSNNNDVEGISALALHRISKTLTMMLLMMMIIL